MKADSRVYLEMIDFIVSRATPEAVLEFRPSEASQHRVSELIERQQQGALSPEEASDLNDFLRLEHLLIMSKAQARLRLHLAAGN
ncbi:MAG TPA: hypothetical protein VGL53_11600 [Bryobacteraceae bacterium]|jgi:hypothetical protein